jgi:DNA-binding SARP family transcriptional activator
MDLPGRTLDWAAIKPRTRMALRLLAMHGGRPVHRDVLMAALWPDMDPSSATRNLHVALSSLRTFFDPGLPRGRCQLIVRSGDAYEFALPPGGELDVVLFTGAIAAARRAQLDGNDTAMRNALREALGHYSGDLLPEDGAAEWVATTRESYRQQAAAAAEQLAAAELDAGDPAGALTAAERCLAIDTYRDRAWRLVVEAQRCLGNHAAADRAGRDYAAMLASLGLAPSGEPLDVPPSVAQSPRTGLRTVDTRSPDRREASATLVRQREPSPARTPVGSAAARSER